MFNIGGGEALVIALIALIVLGPNRLPEAARTVGKVVGEVRRLSSGFQSEVRDAFKEADTPASPAPRKREAAPLGSAVDQLNASSDTRDDLAPEPVEASEPARPATTMADADRGPSTVIVPASGAHVSPSPATVSPAGATRNGNGNGSQAAGEVAPEVADALDEILAPPAASPPPPEADTAP